ncbi:MAG TPA: SRPBCC family protein [Terriglobales bacterium]|nr:SRPBCC family protein [Terriglobales bacterium]
MEPTLLNTIATPAVQESADSDDKHGHKAAWGAMLAGAALSVYGWTRRSASGVALGVAGGAIALKAASAGPIADLVGTETSLSHSVIIMRSAADICRFWQETERIPQWMENVRSVKRLDDRRSVWSRVHPELGIIEWTNEMIDEIPNQSLRWRTLGANGSDYDLSGRLSLTGLGTHRGTLVTLTLQYKMHTGLLHSGAPIIIAPDPQRHLRESLRRFKMLLEAGEIATIRGQSHGPRTLKGKLMETIIGEAA